MRDLEALLKSLVNIDGHSLVAILSSEAEAAQRSVNSARQRAASQRAKLYLAMMRQIATPVSFSRSAMMSSVWPSYGFAVQRLGVQYELPALGRGDRRRDGDFAAELKGFVGLALADALDLGPVQGTDLVPALTLLLMAHPKHEIEQRAEAIFEHLVALDLAANVTDDADEPRA
jgi:hypothetical protein